MNYKRALLLLVFLTVLSSGNCEQYPYKATGPFKEYRERRLELVAKFVPENPRIFEAGARYGQDTVRFIQQWPGAHIVSFEPNPHAFEKLLSELDGYDQIDCHNLAVNNYNGQAILHVCHGSSGDDPASEGASSLLEPSPYMAIHYQGPKVSVPCVILDDWCKKNQPEYFDFLWLDLEGLEFQVLESSPNVLKNAKAIYVETNFQLFRKGMTQFNTLQRFLQRAGFAIAGHWYLVGLQGNALFVKKELLTQVLSK